MAKKIMHFMLLLNSQIWF